MVCFVIWHISSCINATCLSITLSLEAADKPLPRNMTANRERKEPIVSAITIAMSRGHYCMLRVTIEESACDLNHCVSITLCTEYLRQKRGEPPYCKRRIRVKLTPGSRSSSFSFYENREVSSSN